MIQILYGPKGTGKTKQIIDMANQHMQQAAGNIIFIDDDKDYMYEVKRPIRFIDASEYYLGNPQTLLGFIGGLTASDYDLEAVYIDGFLRILDCDAVDDLAWFFEELATITTDIKLVISIRGDLAAAPEFLKPYIA